MGQTKLRFSSALTDLTCTSCTQTMAAQIATTNQTSQCMTQQNFQPLTAWMVVKFTSLKSTTGSKTAWMQMMSQPTKILSRATSIATMEFHTFTFHKSTTAQQTVLMVKMRQPLTKMVTTPLPSNANTLETLYHSHTSTTVRKIAITAMTSHTSQKKRLRPSIALMVPIPLISQKSTMNTKTVRTHLTNQNTI